MNRVLVVFVLLLFLIIASCMPQMPARMATHMAKTGLVIDTETGKPMPNVIVIASGWSSQGGVLVGNGGYSTLYRIVTTTDAEGRYHIPTTWLDMSPWVPGFYPRVGWVVTVFQTGYAVVGDERAWEADSRGMMDRQAASGLVTPSYSYKGSFIEVDPIRMYKPTLTLKEAGHYYSDLKGVGFPYFASEEPGDLAIRKMGYALFAPWVCSLDPDTELDRSTTNGAVEFAEDPINAIDLKRKLAPIGLSRDVKDIPPASAGNVCKIITNGRGVP
jgi:hypothetical protein